MDGLIPYVAYYASGTRSKFWAEDEQHAIEQAEDELKEIEDTLVNVKPMKVITGTIKLILLPDEIDPWQWDWYELLDITGIEDVEIDFGFGGV